MLALRRWLSEPIPAASLVAFRIAFGLAGFVAAVRFVARGWVETLLVAPTHHLTYPGFEWVVEPSAPVLYALFATMAISSLGVAAGAFHRACALAYFASFTYVELIDQALYLNHYYAVSVLAFLVVAMPLGEAYSFDAFRRGSRRTTLPRWPMLLLRAQLGLVYFFAGVAKLHPDWWSRAEPMRTWLSSRTDLPILGPLFEYDATAYAMSWAGLVFDLGVPFALSLRRTRLLAYVAVVAFHAITGSMFRIGLFPLIMIVLTPIFFPPDWPLALARRIRGGATTPTAAGPAEGTPLGILPTAAIALHLAVQVLLPLRHLAMPGDLLWTYEGFNFAWHVMIAEKGASAELLVVDRDDGTRFLVSPDDYYTPLQTRMMSENPALVVQFAHLAARDLARRGRPHVAIYARSYASLNGRSTQPLVDPDIDLTTIRELQSTSDYVVPLEGDDHVFAGYRSGIR